jgi:hypothetical protein
MKQSADRPARLRLVVKRTLAEIELAHETRRAVSRRITSL